MKAKKILSILLSSIIALNTSLPASATENSNTSNASIVSSSLNLKETLITLGTIGISYLIYKFWPKKISLTPDDSRYKFNSKTGKAKINMQTRALNATEIVDKMNSIQSHRVLGARSCDPPEMGSGRDENGSDDQPFIIFEQHKFTDKCLSKNCNTTDDLMVNVPDINNIISQRPKESEKERDYHITRLDYAEKSPVTLEGLDLNIYKKLKNDFYLPNKKPSNNSVYERPYVSIFYNEDKK